MEITYNKVCFFLLSRIIMTTKEKTKLIKQAGKLYTLGLTVEKR